MDDPRAADLEAVALLNEPARRRLYDWVSAQPEAVGRDEAAAAVGITRALAAFHLERLMRAGLLDAEYRRLTGRTGPGAGRPAKLYRRSSREVEVSVPARRYGFAADLFARALEAGGAERLEDVAHETGERLARDSRPARSRGKKALQSVLDAAGYEPRADADGTIRLRNCPFYALVDEHRDLVCGMNLSMAEGIVDGTNATTYEPVLDPQPGWCCVTYRPVPG
jgi:predicted ArsR family transcriptional regulator